MKAAIEATAPRAAQRVFFSYSRGNLRTVLAVSRQLRAFGIDTWVDVERLRVGERWKVAIEGALQSSDAMALRSCAPSARALAAFARALSTKMGSL